MSKKLQKILALALALALTLTLFACNKDGGGKNDNTIKRGESSSVRNGKIELKGVTLDFLGNNVPDGGAAMTELLPTDKQKPDGMFSGLFEVELEPECAEPVTLAIPVDESKIPGDKNTEALLAIGSKFEDSEGDYTTYIYLPVTISDGKATGQFIPANFLQGLVTDGDDGGRRTPFAGVFNSYITIKRTQQLEIELGEGDFQVPFIIYSPYAETDGNASTDALSHRIGQEDLALLGGIFDAFLGEFQDLYQQRTVWPFQIYYDPDFQGARYELSTIKYDPNTPDSGQIYWNGNAADGIIRIGRNYYGNSNFDESVLKTKLVHEFAHWLIACHAVGLGYSYNTPRWMDEAFAGYCVAIATSSFESETLANYRLLFDGMIPKSNDAAEGSARALLLYHMSVLLAGSDDNPRSPAASARAFLSYCLPDGVSLLERALDEATGFVVGGLFDELIGYTPTERKPYIEGHGGPGSFYSEALSGSLGKPLACDLQEEDTPEDNAVIGQVTFPVNRYGARFAAVTFTDGLLKRLAEISEDKDIEAVFTLSGDLGDMKLFEISPDGKTRWLHANSTENLMERIEAGYKYLVMVVGYEKGEVPKNYTVTVELAEEAEDIYGMYSGTGTPTDDRGYFVNYMTAGGGLKFEVYQNDSGKNTVTIRGFDFPGSARDVMIDHDSKTLSATGEAGSNRLGMNATYSVGSDGSITISGTLTIIGIAWGANDERQDDTYEHLNFTVIKLKE